jgi:hypothetical protein
VDTDKDYIIPTMEYVVPVYKRMHKTFQHLKKTKAALEVRACRPFKPCNRCANFMSRSY